MKYLVDTNVFMHTIDHNIYEVAEKCDKQKNRICITQTILDELEPSFYKLTEDKSSQEVFNSVQNIMNLFHLIELIDIDSIPNARDELNKIRKKFYSWTKDHAYLQKLIADGVLKREDVRLLGKKDLGECELIAIAKASNGTFWVITNDLGRVFLHPSQNLFDIYKDDPSINIISGENWLLKIHSTSFSSK